MGRQGKAKRPDFVGKGKVTPVQIAFIVDRYLSDNSFTQTRSSFRSEASHLLSKSPVQEAPRSLLSLGAILEEYITLKEQKVWVDQERCRLEQESSRVQNFLKVMQDVMNAYNAGTNHVIAPSPQPPPPPLVASGIRAENSAGTPGGPFPMYKSQSMVSVSRPLSNRTNSNNFSTPVTNHGTTKRKGSKNVSGDPAILKKSRSSTQSKDVNLATQVNRAETNQGKSLMNSFTHSSCLDNSNSNGSQLQGSNVVKCLFNQKPQSPPINAAVPKTPQQASSSSETEKSISTSETYSTSTFAKDITPQRMMSTNCTIISSETIQFSPNKQISYYSIEKNSCFSTCSPVKTITKCSNIKDHVKGRLNFDDPEMQTVTENLSPAGTSTSASESDKEGDILDLEFPTDFNLSEFLLEFDMESEGLGLSSQAPDSSPDSYTGPFASLVDTTQQFSSDVTGILEDKDMNVIGPDSIATMRSVTKCVILSRVKNQRSSSDQENTPARN